jgi:hypothetical protein
VKAAEPLEKMHGMLLEALRHREQEIFNYLAILGPALAGFAGILYKDQTRGVTTGLFLFGTASVLSLLFFGAVYSLMLGYNYRYITLQLAKIEYILSMTDAMLKKWPKLPEDFDRYKCFSIWVCTPPEIVKVFWEAFLAGIVGVVVTACLWRRECLVYAFASSLGAVFLIPGGILLPIWLGCKLHALRDQETKEDWIAAKKSLSEEAP